MKKKIILVEGIPGSGKSTFARFLSNQFERNGFTCRLFLETTYDHPIIESTGYTDHSLFLEAYYERWAKFLDNFPDEEIVLMESAFFQSPIVHLLHKDVDREIITTQFYLDDISVLVSFISDKSKVTGLWITEKDLFANRKDEGTVFERIS